MIPPRRAGLRAGRAAALVATTIVGGACGSELPAPPSLEPGAPAAEASAPDASPLSSFARALTQIPAGHICSQDGWCWMRPSLPTQDLTSIAGTANDVWLGGWADTALRWDGTSISPVPTGLSSVYAIHPSADGTVWLGGGGGVVQWNGGKLVNRGRNPFSSFWGSSDGTLWAGGLSTALGHWTGSSFAWVPQVSGEVVGGTAADDIWSGGSAGLFHFDGAAWTPVDALRGYSFDVIHAFGRRDVWACAVRSGVYYVFYFDGDRWTVPLQLSTLDARISAITGTGPSDVWLVGGRRNPVTQSGFLSYALHYDGRRLTEAPLGPANLEGASTLDGESFAVGELGTVLRLRSQPEVGFDVLTTPPQLAAPSSRASAVWGSSPRSVWAVGEYGAAWRFEGSRVVTIETGTQERLYDVVGSSESDVWMAGAHGTLLHWTPEAGVRKVDVGVDGALGKVFSASPDEVWVSGDEKARLLRITPNGFERVNAPWLDATYVLDIHGSAKDDVWVLTGKGPAHWDGRTWTPPAGTRTNMQRIWAIAPDDVWMTSDTIYRSTILYQHWDGKVWTDRSGPESADTWMFPWNWGGNYGTSSWAFSPDEVWTTNTGGSVLRKRKSAP